MIRQGDKAQTNYRYFKTLPGKAKTVRMYKNIVRTRPSHLSYSQTYRLSIRCIARTSASCHLILEVLMRERERQ